MKKLILYIVFNLLYTYVYGSELPVIYNLEKNWKFTRNDDEKFSQIQYDDSEWQSVVVPHDWAIYGPFCVANDRQNLSIEQDGLNESVEHAGRTGGLPFVGVGWYRLNFDAQSFKKGNKAYILFDGAMSNAKVYLNGKYVGNWPYGYNSFYFDITEYLNEGRNNILAVRLDNKKESSRWYPGAGLYRNVHLIVKDSVNIPIWGTKITTPIVNDEFAQVNISLPINNYNVNRINSYRVITTIKDSENNIVAQADDRLEKYDMGVLEQKIIIDTPFLWDTDTPYLYDVCSTLYDGDRKCDVFETKLGIRSIEIIPGKGFFLNGKETKFKGVCLHHDLGPLGTAVNESAIKRQIRILKDMGCNAIRTSHNMPAPELVNACDEMGMMLMIETFDEWKTQKLPNGYHNLFDEWAEKDLVNVLRHYRNNASVIMWCIGNEVPDQRNKENGAKIARFLQDICHREDDTRPVTLGMDDIDSAIENNIAPIIDVVGLNYRVHKYEKTYKTLPQQIILGTETASTVSSRGVYKFPVKRASMKRYYEDHQSSSYDLECCDWSNLPEDDFVQHEDLPYCIGEFVWTGFDYLGEPTPYYTDWPSHSSLFGIVDLAGLPKDRYFLYRSHWNEKESTLHVLPHWNWEGKEGQIIPIFVYTSYPSAELFINGKSQGVLVKDSCVNVFNSLDKKSEAELKRQKRYRLMWNNTKYEPGTVKVVAYDDNKNPVEETEVKTAGKPYKIELIPDKKILKADGKDLCFITVRVVDKNGIFCPTALNEISFKVAGEGFYRAGANGNTTSLELFHLPKMKLFSGKMTAIVQTTEEPGNIIVEANGNGLRKCVINLKSEL